CCVTRVSPMVRKESKTVMRIGIIGGGKVGTCLAGYVKHCLVGITTKSTEHTEQLAQSFGVSACTNAELVERAEVLLVTVPDRLISTVATDLAKEAAVAGKIFLHCSGSLGIEELAPLQQAGAHIGSLHPLQSFAGGLAELAGVYMAVDGDELAQNAAKELAQMLGGHAFHVPAAERAAYHAAACICSNYAVAVEALAQQLMSRWLGDEAAAWQALLPLFKGTATNLQNTASPRTVLTGPIARGDAGTVAKHLAVLPSELVDVYCSLGLATIALALTNGTIDKAAADQLARLLQR
ncbi:MAG: Rossmann-like and DUF2520 domain-containing protein, partial [Phascolarctobacterium sp.]